MLQDSVARVMEQAENSSADVRAAALLRIARVQSAYDSVAARVTFRSGLDAVRALSGRDKQFLLEQSRMLAAAVAPELLNEIEINTPLHGGRVPLRFSSYRIGKNMLEHKHLDAACDFVTNYADAATFPFMVVPELMSRLGDPQRKASLLRRALEAGRGSMDHDFVWLFGACWKELPPDEAAAAARELVRTALEHSDNPITASYDQEHKVQITSTREHTLFQILHILRHLEPGLAETLISSHSQLAAAAAVYPNGTESILAESEARGREEAQKEQESSASPRRGYGMGGDPRDFPYMKTLIDGMEDGDFRESITYAEEKYKMDAHPASPNQVPKEFWPSTHAFRQILFQSGKRLGEDAVRYLEFVGDSDVRLFAEIEWLAALAGLPEFQSIQREYRPPSKNPATRK